MVPLVNVCIDVTFLSSLWCFVWFLKANGIVTFYLLTLFKWNLFQTLIVIFRADNVIWSAPVLKKNEDSKMDEKEGNL